MNLASAVRMVELSAIREFSLTCPKCSQDARLTGMDLTRRAIVVQAHCESCKTVIGREFLFAGGAQ